MASRVTTVATYAGGDSIRSPRSRVRRVRKAAELHIHLDRSSLQGLTIEGAAAQLTLRLTAPQERTPIEIAGSVS